MMLKVLLVDDEPFILQGLKVLVEWQEQGFEIVGTASNGLEALEFLRTESVDLVLADIKMPIMSGLELLETIRKEKITETYFAILSGYNDFEYARRAIHHDCVDYILKPVKKEELLRLLKRVSDMHVDTMRKKEQSSVQEKAYFTRNLISVLYGKYDDLNLDYVAGKLQLQGGIRYITIEIDAGDDDAYRSVEEENLRLQRKLYEVCMELLPEYHYHWVFDVSKNENRYDVGFIYCENMAMEAGLQEQEYLDQLLSRIRQVMNVPIIMLVGKKVDMLSQLGDSFRTVAVVRSFQDFKLNREAAITDMKERTGDILCKQTLDALINAVEQNNKEEMTKCVEHVYEEISCNSMDAGMVNINMNYLLFRLVHLATEQDENVNQKEILAFISANAFEEGIRRGSKQHLLRFAEEYADYLTQLRGKAARGVLADIEKEIRENYTKNLTLKEMSQKYYVNSAYLGQMFRKKYGVSFKDYLNNYRMERATALLLHTNMKIYEIAERTGYHDVDYFVNRFISAKGCTPARFRRQSMEQHGEDEETKNIT